MPQAGTSKNVLVGVIPTQRDLKILLREHWYRIPLVHLPTRPFVYLAFYQPAALQQRGKRIEYYARVLKKEVVPRIALLPREKKHPRAGELYAKFTVATPRKLARPIRNVIPRRVTFGFTDLASLTNARDILELYHVPKTEQIVAAELVRRGIETMKEYTVSCGAKRVRLDLAIITEQKKIAIECDNQKAHASKTQKEKDKAKDDFLKKLGWCVIRLSESDVLDRLNRSVTHILLHQDKATTP